MGLLAEIIAQAIVNAIAGPRQREQQHRRNCSGHHCSHPGHEYFCLTRYVNYTDNSGRYYCNKHFRQRLGLRRR
jgi:hypothetical protein